MKTKFILGALGMLALLALPATAQVTVSTVISSSLGEPYNVAEDTNGNIFISDSVYDCIVEINVIYDTTNILAGVSGTAGSNDGPAAGPNPAHFNNPQGLLPVTLDGTNGLLVADTGNNLIRFVRFSDGYTITLAGNTTGSPINPPVNATGTNAVFNYPVGMDQDGNGNVYIADENDSTIRVMNLNDPAFGVTNLIVTGTSFYRPNAVAYAGGGQLWVCDWYYNAVKLITLSTPTSGNMTSYMGSGVHQNGSGTTDNAFGPSARFNKPAGLLWIGNALLISDTGNDSIRYATNNTLYGANNYSVSTYAGIPQTPGFVNGNAGSAEFNQPEGMCQDFENSAFLVADLANNAIRSMQYGPPRPHEPTGLTAAATTNINVQVVLTWNASLNSTSYNVQRSPSSGGPYTLIGNTGATTFTDTNVVEGATYYYVVAGVNSAGASANSTEVSIFIPIPPPPPPVIGWFDYEGALDTGFFTVLYPVSGTPFVTYNDLNLAVYPTVSGLGTYYINGPNPLSGSPSKTNGSSPPYFKDGLLYAQPLPVTITPDLVIEAVNVNGVGESSSIATAEFLFEVASPTITGNNAAAFTISDITTNAVFWYTTDGSIPTNAAPSIGPITSTNGSPVTISLDGSSNILFQVRAFRDGYFPSGVAVQSFSTNAYVPNIISFGFQSGPGSSHLIASPGQFFMAPVALSLISPSTIVESMQFALTATNVIGTHPVDPTAGFSFSSLVFEPDPQDSSVFISIPTWSFVTTNASPPSYDTNLIFSTFYGTDPNGSWFQNMQFINQSENLLGVGWLEMHGQKNLYNTLAQELITTSLFGYGVSGWMNELTPPAVIMGGYSFPIPPDATSNDVYQIQIIRPSASGYPDGAVYIEAPTNTDAASLGYGSLNAIKNVTIGQLKYLVGDVYPAPWYNAGDFGSSNLINEDVQIVFNAAIYSMNTPIPSTDLYDALDSCGNFGTYDGDTTDVNYGYYTNNNSAANINPVSTDGFTPNTDLNNVQLNGLFNGNDNNINQIVFGDGVLDVCDVYVTYRRSLDPSLAWYQRFWNNGHRVAQTVPNQVVYTAGLKQPAGIQPADTSPNSSPISITNTPSVIFTAADYMATPGQQFTIPITASVFGQYPLRVAMLNISVVPLDGSPALTTPISFEPGAALGTPYMTSSDADNNYAAVWLDSTIAGIPNSGTIGTLTITIPTNATSMSSYGIHFDHASGSPNGLASFHKTTYTGLITLSSRTNSYYNDGIPDSWRLRYFGTIYNLLSVSNADADGTPFNNWQKYIAGLNPTDPTSVLAAGLDQPMATQTNDCVIDWPSVNGVQYVIQRSPTLFPAVWTAISTNTGTGGYMEIHDTAGGKSRFYRVSTP